MKNYFSILFLVSTLVMGCAGGCSGNKEGTAESKSHDLGKVELVPGQPTNFKLGQHQSCVLTGRETPQGIEVRFVITWTNADKAITRSESTVEIPAGRHCLVGFGDETLGFAPTLKNQ